MKFTRVTHLWRLCLAFFLLYSNSYHNMIKMLSLFLIFHYCQWLSCYNSFHAEDILSYNVIIMTNLLQKRIHNVDYLGKKLKIDNNCLGFEHVRCNPILLIFTCNLGCVLHIKTLNNFYWRPNCLLFFVFISIKYTQFNYNCIN